MENKVAIVFDGDNTHSIPTENFFQDEAIAKLGPVEIFTFYQATAVYASTLDTVKKLEKEGKIPVKTAGHIEDDYVAQVVNGKEILEIMVKDTFGEKISTHLIKELNEMIESEVNEEEVLNEDV